MRGLTRLGLTVALAALSLTGCSVFSGSATYRPPFVPVEFEIDTTGKITVSAGRNVVTPWGTFGAKAELSPEIGGDDETVVILKRELDGRTQQDVFTLAQQGGSACLDGTFVLGTGKEHTIELFALGGSTVRIVDSGSVPDGCRGSGGGPDATVAGVDGWVAQLASIRDTYGPEEVERTRQELSDSIGRPVSVVRSADYGSLRAGWWMFYYPGRFADGRAALAFCAAQGRTADSECVGRWLSRDPADRRYICHVPGVTVPSVCRR